MPVLFSSYKSPVGTSRTLRRCRVREVQPPLGWMEHQATGSIIGSLRENHLLKDTAVEAGAPQLVLCAQRVFDSGKCSHTCASKADMTLCSANVCLRPKGDIGQLHLPRELSDTSLP